MSSPSCQVSHKYHCGTLLFSHNDLFTIKQELQSPSSADSNNDVFFDALEEILRESEDEVFEDALQSPPTSAEVIPVFGEEEGEGSMTGSIRQSSSIQGDRRDLQAVGRRILPPTFSSAATLSKRRSREPSSDGGESEAGGSSRAETSSGARKRRKLWTSEETRAVEEGLSRFGPRWMEIKRAFAEELRDRTSVQIKDKARTEYNCRLKANMPLEMYECLRRGPDDARPRRGGRR